jgi:Holliday junction DNA helicase RuvA
VIAALAGMLAEKSPERLVVDVGGVGYAVHVSLQTFAELPPAGSAVRLLVHTEVREDAIELFGFVAPDERTLFHLLRKVKGLGPRTALWCSRGCYAGARATIAGDAAPPGHPGVGKKTPSAS